MSTVADVLAAVAAALPALDGWRVVDVPPPTTGLPAMWVELVGGGGTMTNPLGVPLTVRVVAVPRPQPTPAAYPLLADLVDALDTALRPVAVPGGAVTDARWRLDRVDVGAVAHTAVLYDLTATHHPTC